MTLSKPQAVSSSPSHATAHPPRPASACVHASTLCRKPAASRGLACSRTATSATRTGEAKDTVSWYVPWSRRAGAHEPAFSVAQSPSLCEGGPTASSAAQSPPYSDVAYASAAYCVTYSRSRRRGVPEVCRDMTALSPRSQTSSHAGAAHSHAHALVTEHATPTVPPEPKAR